MPREKGMSYFDGVESSIPEGGDSQNELDGNKLTQGKPTVVASEARQSREQSFELWIASCLV